MRQIKAFFRLHRQSRHVSHTWAWIRKPLGHPEADEHFQGPHERVKRMTEGEESHNTLIVESRSVNSYCAGNKSENDDRQEPVPGKIHQVTSEEIQSKQGKAKYQKT